MPPPITTAQYVEAGVVVTPSPTFGGTVKPTVNVFGSGLGSASKAHLDHHQLHLEGTDLPVDVGVSPDSVGNTEGEGGREESWEAPADSFALLNELMKKRSKEPH